MLKRLAIAAVLSFGAVSASHSAVCAQALVLRTTGTYTAGQLLPESAVISLGERARILVLYGRATRVVCGPSRVPVRQLATSRTCQRYITPSSRRLAAASRNDGRFGDIIMVDRIAVARRPGSIGEANAPGDRPQTTCFGDWERVRFQWRRGSSPTLDGVALTGRQNRAVFIASWPEGVPQVTGRDYRLIGTPGASPTTIVHIDTSNPDRAVEEVLRRGCMNDLDRLADYFPAQGLNWSEVPPIEHGIFGIEDK